MNSLDKLVFGDTLMFEDSSGSCAIACMLLEAFHDQIVHGLLIMKQLIFVQARVSSPYVHVHRPNRECYVCYDESASYLRPWKTYSLRANSCARLDDLPP